MRYEKPRNSMRWSRCSRWTGCGSPRLPAPTSSSRAWSAGAVAPRGPKIGWYVSTA